MLIDIIKLWVLTCWWISWYLKNWLLISKKIKWIIVLFYIKILDIKKCPFLKISNRYLYPDYCEIYSLIIGNGYSDRSRTPHPISFLQESYFRWWWLPVFSGFKSSILPDGPLYFHVFKCRYIIVLYEFWLNAFGI